MKNQLIDFWKFMWKRHDFISAIFCAFALMVGVIGIGMILGFVNNWNPWVLPTIAAILVIVRVVFLLKEYKHWSSGG